MQEGIQDKTTSETASRHIDVMQFCSLLGNKVQKSD